MLLWSDLKTEEKEFLKQVIDKFLSEQGESIHLVLALNEPAVIAQLFADRAWYLLVEPWKENPLSRRIMFEHHFEKEVCLMVGHRLHRQALGLSTWD